METYTKSSCRYGYSTFCLDLLVNNFGTDGHATHIRGDEADVCLVRVDFRHLVSTLASDADDVHNPTKHLLHRPERDE